MIEKLFHALCQAESSDDVAAALEVANIAWKPLGGDENYFGVIENQQASPIAALIEKITNSIDAILLRKCIEAGIDPRLPDAPQSMEEAISMFYGSDSSMWHLTGPRKQQALSIQIVANGSKRRPCLTIYDDGEGQHPENFESTFLSVLRGNKNEIRFVQGKYNMGGTGAIVFCGEHGYQLIGSRRFDESGEFGFTLVRKHPMSDEEKRTKKNTWYEYLVIDGEIPRFPITELDLGLADRTFTTGTVIKLFDYDLPSGSRGALPQEPRRAINQYLFEPALPIYLKDCPKRYPKNKVLEGDCFGLKRRLEDDSVSKYVDESFAEEIDYPDIGRIKATCYVFRAKVNGRSLKETRDIITREFFHDNMSTLFSLNGQVHGHFTSEFISRTLKMPLLKNHLLIHVDCGGLDYDFRHELFMASRDRLKGGDKTAELRKRLAELLLKGRIKDIYKARKNAISVEGGDAKDLLRSFSKNLPLNKDLMKLLSQTFKIEQQDERKKKKPKPKKPKEQKVKEPFHPQRYPSFFRMKGGGRQFLTIPERDDKTVQFSTDVEDQYFDRSDDPGDLQISILQHRTNDSEGGNGPGTVDSPERLLTIRKSSPKDGTIRIGLTANKDLKVGDEVEVKAALGGPEDLEYVFWAKITEPKQKPQEIKKPKKDEEPPAGLPDYVLCYQIAPKDANGAVTWEALESSNVEMGFETVMHPMVDGERNLEKVFINMDSRVLRNYISQQGTVSSDQKEVAEKRYISAIYFHTIFLFTITRGKNYQLRQGEAEVDLADYLREVFSSYYCEFLLNFGTEQLMASLED